MINFPGNFPGFLAHIKGFEVFNAIAVPNINPLASIAINASASIIDCERDIWLINSLKIIGSLNMVSKSLKIIPLLGKSG